MWCPRADSGPHLGCLLTTPAAVWQRRNRDLRDIRKKIFVLLLHLRLAPSFSSCSFIFVFLLHFRISPSFSSFSFIFVFLLHFRLAPSSSSCCFIFVLLLHFRLSPPSSSFSFIFVLLLQIRLAPSYSPCSFIFVLFLHIRLAPSYTPCSFIFVLLLHIRLAPSSSPCSFIFVLLLHIRFAPSSCSFIFVLLLHLSLSPSSSSCSIIFVLLLRSLLTTEATATLVSAFILSRLDYCNSLLSGCPRSLILRLQKVQNNAARLILRISKREHISPHLASLHWLPIDSRIKYKLACICYNAMSTNSPPYLSDLLTVYTASRQLRSCSDNSVLRRPSALTVSYGQRSFAYSAPSAWNALPQQVRSSDSVST